MGRRKDRLRGKDGEGECRAQLSVYILWTHARDGDRSHYLNEMSFPEASRVWEAASLSSLLLMHSFIRPGKWDCSHEERGESGCPGLWDRK